VLCYWGDAIREGFWCGNVEEGDHFEDLDIDERFLLKSDLKEDGRTWAEVILRPRGGLLCGGSYGQHIGGEECADWPNGELIALRGRTCLVELHSNSVGWLLS
jgi:hypothetical protein